MSKKPRSLARRAVQALTVAAMAAVGVVVVAGPAQAAPPAITSVFVVGSTTNKVVTAGTTVLITGTGFGGMTDNAADPACSIAPVAYPTASSGCSQVRFLGMLATATSGFTLATRYTVVSDTQIYATVPAITPSDGATAGAPAAGTGSIKVQVVNTMGTGTSSLISASTTSEVFYRHALTAVVVSTSVAANPLGGGTLVVPVTGVAPLTTTTFPLEKISAYFVSLVTGSPSVIPTAVNFNNATSVSVVLPPGTPAGNFVGITLVHDGIAGVADSDSLKYPAIITKLESCTTDVTTVSFPLPTTCTGTATAPGVAGPADVKVTGKGLTGATAWSFDGDGGAVTETCTVVSDSVAYCHLAITTVPSPAVAAVTFTPADLDGAGPGTAPALVPTAGSILIYSSLV